MILVVTDPPDPLADVARRRAGHDRVLGTGTFLDSLRFRVHLAERLDLSPDSVDALVVGEHGKSSVFLWSSVKVGAIPISDLVAQRGLPFDEFQREIERAVRDANINIIEGNGASQFGIGVVAARIAEMVLRDERAVVPVGSHNNGYGVALSLPSILGRWGVAQILEPAMSEEERDALELSAETLRKAEQQMVRYTGTSLSGSRPWIVTSRAAISGSRGCR